MLFRNIQVIRLRKGEPPLESHVLCRSCACSVLALPMRCLYYQSCVGPASTVWVSPPLCVAGSCLCCTRQRAPPSEVVSLCCTRQRAPPSEVVLLEAAGPTLWGRGVAQCLAVWLVFLIIICSNMHKIYSLIHCYLSPASHEVFPTYMFRLAVNIVVDGKPPQPIPRITTLISMTTTHLRCFFY